jgi:hypothetical protein
MEAIEWPEEDRSEELLDKVEELLHRKPDMDQYVPAWHVWTPSQRGWWVIKFALSLVWGMPFAALGLFCGLTIVLAPVGVVLLAISGWPMARLIRKKTADASHLAREIASRKS